MAGVVGRSLIDEITPEVVAWRRHFHRFPELSFEEHETSRFIAGQLERMGLGVWQPGGLAVVADIHGGRPGHTVALRADMDALPLSEETGLPFASAHQGVMHACGHDGHMAILLGVARVLTDIAGSMAGTVRLIFQPAEERPPGGAVSLVKAGVLNGVEAIAGLHLWADLPFGVGGVNSGPVMAYADEFSVTIRGRGGHGSQPHRTIDPVVLAAQVILNLQTIVSRRVDPARPAVITVGVVNAGRAFNIIPSEASLSGTVRSLDPETRQQLFAEMDRVVKHTCAMAGAEGNLEFFGGYPAVVNHPAVVALLEKAACAVLGKEGLIRYGPVMGGEDFAYYAERIPAAYFFLGAGRPGQHAFPHHHPRFDIDERALPLGIEILARFAMAACEHGVDGVEGRL